MGYIQIHLNPSLDGEKLERILLDSAENLKLKSHSVKGEREFYDAQEGKVKSKYTGESIILTKNHFSLMRISSFKKGESNFWFDLSYGLLDGLFGSKKIVEKYLQEFHKSLQSSNNN